MQWCSPAGTTQPLPLLSFSEDCSKNAISMVRIIGKWLFIAPMSKRSCNTHISALSTIWTSLRSRFIWQEPTTPILMDWIASLTTLQPKTKWFFVKRPWKYSCSAKLSYSRLIQLKYWITLSFGDRSITIQIYC